MPKIAVNFDEVPDEFKAVDPGVYVCSVEEIEIKETAKGDGEKAVVTLKITNEGPMHGRKLYEHIGLKNPITLKRLYKACMGAFPGSSGFDTSDLIGKECRVRVAARTYKDSETGETKETSSVKDYIFT